MLRNLKLISIIVALFLGSLSAEAQRYYPDSIGENVKYEVVIEMPKAYVSGIMILQRATEREVNGSIINEFGFSLIDFTYDEKKEKVKLQSVMKKLDRWYIKRTLRGDIKKMLSSAKDGASEYYNKKRKIKYTFNILNDTKGQFIYDSQSSEE